MVLKGSSSSLEVNAVKVNDIMNCFDPQADEQLFSPECSYVYDVFDDQYIPPRVGKEYQVEIPPLISESDPYWFQKNPPFHDFRVGLPIPIMWIKVEVENSEHHPLKHACKSIGLVNKFDSSKLECIRETQNNLGFDKLNPQPEAIDSALIKTMTLGESGYSNVEQETNIGMHDKNRGKSHCLVPGSASNTWNEIEETSFTLGLYIFGKNLVQVKRFIGNKKMGDILSFYYGKFYKSERYQRWSECRKMKSRKCIYGPKIFTGPRQQELLSRLLPNVSEECRLKLLEVSKIFVEGKMLLEDYVLTLKASVGLHALVEAVGVGKGKEDLTGLAADSIKSTQALPVRPEIPVGKACSKLKPAEIISFLTGDFRLSKARSSDLFWEAVWPRLLARGWHSEQPVSYNYAVASKHPLVFLVPGVKKFSRKLVKGNHYFDSVTDVLGKVALDPELIELETVADNDCTNLDRDKSPDQQRHCYLKPRTPTHITGEIKFTVVDTSLANEKMRKVRELRTLPDGVLEASTSDDEDTSEEQTTESDSANTMCIDKVQTDSTEAGKSNIGSGVSSDMNGLENNPPKELPMSSIVPCNLSAASRGSKTDLLSNTQRLDAMKCQSIQRIVTDNKDVLVPVTKRRRRLTACSHAERNCNSANIFMVPGVRQQEASSCPDNSKSSEKATANLFVAPGLTQEKASCCPCNSKLSGSVLSQETPPEENKLLAHIVPPEIKTSADPLSKPSSIISREATSASSSCGPKDQCAKPMIDLNLPVSPEVEADEPFVTEATEREQNNTRKESDDLSVGTISKPVNHSEHQPDMNPRRKSARVGPPTAKVLEALAFGYLDPKEKRKGRDYLGEGSKSRSSRHKHRKVAGETSSSSVADSHEEEKANALSNGSVDDKKDENDKKDQVFK